MRVDTYLGFDLIFVLESYGPKSPVSSMQIDNSFVIEKNAEVLPRFGGPRGLPQPTYNITYH